MMTPSITDLHDFEAEKCPHCGFEKRWRDVPKWVKEGAIFAYEGVTYRVVIAYGLYNGGRYYPHGHAFVRAEPMKDAKWTGLPEAPCPVSTFMAALSTLSTLPRITAWDLERAIHLEPTT